MFKLFGPSKPRQSGGAGDAGADGVGPTGAATAAGIRRAADEARDARRWRDAASLYLAYLDLAPDDVAIRIQAGNCLKEDGRLEEAHAAYRAALALDPRDADGFLQLGHVLKRMGRRGEMIQAFRASLDIQPSSNPARDELLALRVPLTGDGSPALLPATGIFIDVTDLVDYLKSNLSLSGIQRVSSALIVHAAEFNARAGAAEVRFVLPDYSGCTVYELHRETLADAIEALTIGGSSRGELDAALAALQQGRRQVTLRAGDTLVIAGAFWIYPKYDLLNALRQTGALVSVFVHDLIQIYNPEYVPPGATTVFRRSFVDVVTVANYVLTNSKHVAGDVRQFLAERMNFDIPVTAVPLATELGHPATEGEVAAEYVALARQEYVLCVATLEIRKNHLYLLQIWERLHGEFDGDIPNLVFVGKWGWQIEELQQRLYGSDYAGGRLYIFNAIPDRDLAFLYENCLFTVYSSFAEGWGLPIGESLGYGKLCVASNVTSMPEVGGELCRYFDPFDLDDGYRVISGLLADRAELAALTRRIREEFRPTTWRAFSETFFELVQERSDARLPTGRVNNCRIEAGHVVSLGNDPLLQLDLQKRPLLTGRMARMTGWHDIEVWGCWAAKRHATLAFSTDLSAGTAIDVYLHIKTADQDECAVAKVTVGETQTEFDDLCTVPVWCVAGGTVGPDGVVTIAIASGRGFFHRHGRELYVGLIELAVAPVGDAALEARIHRQIMRRGMVRSQRPAHRETARRPVPDMTAAEVD